MFTGTFAIINVYLILNDCTDCNPVKVTFKTPNYLFIKC